MARSTQRPWSLFPRGGKPSPTVRLGRRRSPLVRVLRFESLEDRRLLATVTVGNLNDVVNGTTTSIAALVATPGADGISLREAIIAANADVAADVIDFAPSVTGTIQLTNVGHVGEIGISTALSINGPGAGMLTVRAFAGTAAVGDGARIFNITNFFAFNITVAISGLTLTGGDGAGSGGAIVNQENLTVTACTISGNRAGSQGGGIANTSGGNLTIVNSTISGNTSANSGGGVLSDLGSLSIAQSTISGNAAGNSFNGGGILSSQSTTTIDSSTVSGNSAGGSGGIFSENATLTIANSTISGNSARALGGGIVAFSGLTLRHSTVTLNRSDSDNSGGETGGGMSVSGGAVVEHTIVAGNLRGTGATRDDISGALAAQFSLIGDNTGATITNNGGNLIGTGASPINALLAPLANNGGPTLSHALLGGSLAVDAGDPAAVAGVGIVPLNDQRGAGFARIANGDVVVGARIDIGAYEQQSTQAANLIVDTLADENDGNFSAGDFSLREALGFANSVTGPNTIAFAASLTSGGPATILLTVGELAISRSVNINGPAANLLTIDASGNDPTPTQNNGDGSRVFNIADSVSANFINVMLSGISLTGGDHSSGGGGVFNREQLTLTDCEIANNSSQTGGGGIDNLGSLTLERCTISGNTAGSGSGGGIRNQSDQGFAQIRDSTIQGNSAKNGGGISNFDRGNVILTNSTVSGNTAIIRGGGIHSGTQFGTAATVTVNSSTISGNTGSGGAGVFNEFTTVAIAHSTITNNTSDSPGSFSGHGIMSRISTATITRLHSTIVSGNDKFDLSTLIVLPDPDTGNPYQSEGFNVIGTGTVAPFTQPGDQTGVTNPMLGPLANNGGPTLTHALLAGSPAIDAGDPAAVAGAGNVPLFDQRGAPFGRVADGNGAGGARIDIGAYELPSVAPAADFDADGDVDGADFLTWQRGLGLTGPPATKANGNADGDMDVDGADLAVWRNTFGASGVAAAGGQVSPKLADAEVRRGGLTPATALTPDFVGAAMAYQQMLDQIATGGAGRKRFLRAK